MTTQPPDRLERLLAAAGQGVDPVLGARLQLRVKLQHQVPDVVIDALDASRDTELLIAAASEEALWPRVALRHSHHDRIRAALLRTISDARVSRLLTELPEVYGEDTPDGTAAGEAAPSVHVELLTEAVRRLADGYERAIGDEDAGSMLALGRRVNDISQYSDRFPVEALRPLRRVVAARVASADHLHHAELAVRTPLDGLHAEVGNAAAAAAVLANPTATPAWRAAAVERLVDEVTGGPAGLAIGLPEVLVLACDHLTDSERGEVAAALPHQLPADPALRGVLTDRYLGPCGLLPSVDQVRAAPVERLREWLRSGRLGPTGLAEIALRDDVDRDSALKAATALADEDYEFSGWHRSDEALQAQARVVAHLVEHTTDDGQCPLGPVEPGSDVLTACLGVDGDHLPKLAWTGARTWIRVLFDGGDRGGGLAGRRMTAAHSIAILAAATDAAGAEFAQLTMDQFDRIAMRPRTDLAGWLHDQLVVLDQSQRETFYALYEDWQGSVAGLLETCRELR